MKGALAGLRVLDFSTLLPGPMATLFLADAGAEVIKIERTESGDGARAEAAVFAILNRAKRSIAIDLKQDAHKLTPLIANSDILVEQFRPGVMDRLGLGYDAIRAINPRIIFVSVNGYGSDGPDRLKPGHDLTYAAESGLLGLNVSPDGVPIMPSALTADIAGGSMAALANILLALYNRELTGNGAKVEIAMFAGAIAFLYEPLADAFSGHAPKPGYSATLGSTPRYNIYPTLDGRYLACASVEDVFWANFCDVAQLPYTADIESVRCRMLERTAAAWIAAFQGRDICCSLIATVPEALASEAVRRLLRRRVECEGLDLPALPSLIDRTFLAETVVASAPELGADNGLLDNLNW